MSTVRNIAAVLRSSLVHLRENNQNLTTVDLETEVINLCSYVYLRDTPQIKFSLNYINRNNIDSLDNQDFDVIDKIIDAAVIIFKEFYGYAEAINAKHAIRLNIELYEDYGSFLESYFVSKHKIANRSDVSNMPRVVPKAVSDDIMIRDLTSIRSINNIRELKEYLVKYYNDDNVHPAVIGAAIEKLYSWNDIDGCIEYSSKICNLAPLPTDMTYGSTWWNGVGVYLAYPLVNLKLSDNPDKFYLKNAVFSAYTALCIGISASKGLAYDSLNIRSILMHKYQKLFKMFIQNNIDMSFGNSEIYKMIICDKYMTASLYNEEEMYIEFEQIKESIEPIYNWFVNNESSDVIIKELFIEGDKLHMHYNPDFVQASNDRKFFISRIDYMKLFK